MAIDKITTASITDGTIATADIADGAVTSVKTTGVGGANTPAFFAYKVGGNQVVSDATGTKVTFDTEAYDTANAFSSSKFTVPSGQAGKYYFYGAVNLDGGTYDRLNVVIIYLYKNGTIVSNWRTNFRSNPIYYIEPHFTDTLDLAVGDYIEVYGYVDVVSGTPSINGNGDGRHMTQFGGFKIIE